MTAIYEAYRYAADGHAGEEGDGDVIATGSMVDCREAIAIKIKAASIASAFARLWPGFDDDIEAYHESFAEGCGGYAIRPVRD